MTENILKFKIQTGTIRIDYNRCEPAIKNTSSPSCGFACVKADRLYGRNVLKIEKNKPMLAVPAQEAARLCNECLGCEHDCTYYGRNCIQIELPLFGRNDGKSNVAGDE